MNHHPSVRVATTPKSSIGRLQLSRPEAVMLATLPWPSKEPSWEDLLGQR